MDDATKQLIQLRKQLKEDIENYQYNLGLCMGQEIANDLTETAHLAITNFYSWKPEYYERHWNFWNSYRKVHTNHNGVRTAGVELLLEQFPDDYKTQRSKLPSGKYISTTKYDSYSRFDPKDIFWRVYGFGWHGIASLEKNKNGEWRAPTMSPSPYQLLINKRDEIIKNSDKYQKKASNMARRKKYNLLFK